LHSGWPIHCEKTAQYFVRFFNSVRNYDASLFGEVDRFIDYIHGKSLYDLTSQLPGLTPFPLKSQINLLEIKKQDAAIYQRTIIRNGLEFKMVFMVAESVKYKQNNFIPVGLIDENGKFVINSFPTS
jgi:hypothetical protein